MCFPLLLHFALSITPSLFFKVTNARRGNVEFWFCMSACLINWICSLILNPAWETKQQMPLEAADARTSLYQCPILRSSFSHSNLGLQVLPRDTSRQTSRVNINTLLWLLLTLTVWLKGGEVIVAVHKVLLISQTIFPKIILLHILIDTLGQPVIFNGWAVTLCYKWVHFVNIFFSNTLI